MAMQRTALAALLWANGFSLKIKYYIDIVNQINYLYSKGMKVSRLVALFATSQSYFASITLEKTCQVSQLPFSTGFD